MNRTESRKTRRTKEEVQLSNMSTDELFSGCEEAFQRLTRIKAELKVRFQNLPTNLINELLSQTPAGVASNTMSMGLSSNNINRTYDSNQQMLLPNSQKSMNSLPPTGYSRVLEPGENLQRSPNQDSFIAPLSPDQMELDNQFNHLQTTINNKMAHLQRAQQESVIEEGVAPF